MGDRRFDAIVIGAGFGGASCAGLLARAGRKVLVIEKNNLAGGKTMSHARKGFRYSPWPIIGAPLDGSWASRLVADLGIGTRARLLKVEGRWMYRAPDGSCAPLPSSRSMRSIPMYCSTGSASPRPSAHQALEFMTRLSLMPPDKVEQLEGRDFHGWVQPFGLPASVHAFLVSNCLDDMYVVPSDQLDCERGDQWPAESAARRGRPVLPRRLGRAGRGVLRVRARTRRRGADGHARATDPDRKRCRRRRGDRRRWDPPLVDGNRQRGHAAHGAATRRCAALRWDYAGRIGKLMPSHALVGYRYFLSEPVLDYGYSVIFSNTSAWTRQRFEDARAGRRREKASCSSRCLRTTTPNMRRQAGNW